MSNVGFATLSVIPSFKGFDSSLSSQITGPLANISGKAGDDAAAKFSSTFSKGTAKSGSAAAKSLGSTFAKGLNIAGLAGAATVAGAFFKVITTGFQESKDASAGQAQLAAGIKSTGNIAAVSVPQLEALASSIQKYSGQTDDSIVASEQLLLTFTNIRNAAGKNNDIFDQAVKITADLAAKMGGDASGAAIQLGKALNDPEKGLTALTRIGVSFTAGQKAQIQALVATGDTMGAQKIILGELSKEFGGAAKAAGDSLPGSLNKAKRSFEDMSQSIIESAAPALAKIAGFGATLFSEFTKLNTATGGWAVGLLGLAAALKLVSAAGLSLGALGPTALAVGAAFAGLRAVVKHFDDDGLDSAATTSKLVDGLKQLGKEGTESYLVFTRFGDNFSKLVKAFKDAQHFTGGLSNDIANFGINLVGGTTPLEEAVAPIKNVQKALLELFKTDPKDAVAAFATIKAALIAQGVSAADVDKQFAKYEQTVGVLGQVLAPATAAQEKSAAAQKAAAQATKDHAAALTDLGKLIGPLDAKVIAGMNLSTDSIKNLTKNVADMQDGFGSSFDSALSVLDNFKDKAKVDYQSFIDDQFKTIVATENWSKNIATLAKAGIDQGFLKTLVDAGPSTAALTQSIVDHVKTGSVNTINAMESAARTAKKSTQQNLADLVSGSQAAMNALSQLSANLTITINGQKIPVNEAGDLLQSIRRKGAPLLSGQRAGGGPMTKGHAYLVGENGPEIVVPTVDGNVLSNADSATAMSGGSGPGVWIDKLYARDDHDVARVITREENRKLMLANL